MIFETDTRAGKVFDISLLAAIMLSVVAVSLETVPLFEHSHRRTLRGFEWVLTALFTAEYVLRLTVVREPKRYALSFMGMVDLLSLLPTYLSLFFADAQALQIIRALRLLRVFRVFQLGQMAAEGGSLFVALVAARYKIAVFLGTLLIVVVIQGALLYYVEHAVNEGFSSIPRAVYWAIVTLTTVGYGDISPVTVPGQAIASLLMLLGYGIIAVPTGIVTAEVAISEMSARGVTLDPAPETTLASDACHGAPPAFAWVTGATSSGDSTLLEGAKPPPATPGVGEDDTVEGGTAEPDTVEGDSAVPEPEGAEPADEPEGGES